MNDMSSADAEYRVEAFGAIRRAAEWARSGDAAGGPSNYQRSLAIRQAIRAAIGSPKA